MLGISTLPPVMPKLTLDSCTHYPHWALFKHAKRLLSKVDDNAVGMQLPFPPSFSTYERWVVISNVICVWECFIYTQQFSLFWSVRFTLRHILNARTPRKRGQPSFHKPRVLYARMIPWARLKLRNVRKGAYMDCFKVIILNQHFF
jgi:hypothetical protein